MKDRDIHDESNVWSSDQILKKIYGLDVDVGHDETIDQLAMAGSVLWYGHVLRREHGCVFRRSLDFDVEGGMKKGWPTRTWGKQVKEENVKVGLRRKDALC